MDLSQALSFRGLFSVMVALPPVTSVSTGRSFVFGMAHMSPHSGPHFSGKGCAVGGLPVNAAA
jgi:hypothetical protein